MGNSPNITHTLFSLLMIATKTKLAVIPYTVPDLASMLGYSRPTLDKTLKELYNQGMVSFARLHEREVTKSVVLTKQALNLHITLGIMSNALKQIGDPTDIYLSSKQPLT